MVRINSFKTLEINQRPATIKGGLIKEKKMLNFSKNSFMTF